MTESAAQPDRFVPIGEVVRPVGLRGEVKLYPLLDFHAPLLDSGYLKWQDGSRAEILRHRPAGSCLVLLARGAATREDALALVGRTLGFQAQDYLREDFPRPPQGLPFRYLGRPVVTRSGLDVGTVAEVRWTGGQLLLVVDRGTREVLIPAVPPILSPDEGIAGPLCIAPPEGLLDVDG